VNGKKMEERINLKELIEEVCELLETTYSLEDDVYTLPIKTEDGHTEEVSFYETIDSYDVPKIDCTVTIGPIIKNADLLYTFLKNNFELEYGSFAIINEDDMDILVIVESLIADACISDDLAAIASYIAQVAHETRELISKTS
jgi:hypothetical protein